MGGAGLELARKGRRHRVLRACTAAWNANTASLPASDTGAPISTSRLRRSGWVSATCRAVKALPEWPTTVTRSTLIASRNATASAAKSSMV